MSLAVWLDIGLLIGLPVSCSGVYKRYSIAVAVGDATVMMAISLPRWAVSEIAIGATLPSYVSADVKAALSKQKA